jgi:DNA-binding GntR family transcriptional regulator
MTFEKLDHTNLSKKVVRAIRHQIFSGVLKADERVVESEIARALGISRGPVREALVELEREGLIITYPRKGTYVTNFTDKDIEEIYTLRALLEGHAVTRALDRLEGQDLDRLKDLLNEIGETAEKNDNIDVAQLDMQFHEEICKLADHKRLYDTWKSLLAQIQMLSATATEYYTNVKDVRKRHEVLVDALVKGDRGYVKECFEQHILNSMNGLISHLKKMRGQGPLEAEGVEEQPLAKMKPDVP